jgi:hypothetical protein
MPKYDTGTSEWSATLTLPDYGRVARDSPTGATSHLWGKVVKPQMWTFLTSDDSYKGGRQ